MACVENNVQDNIDSEREEGEIVDELDELSDISSEEEYLLRQRLQVLENYNNVLERKRAKDSSFNNDSLDVTHNIIYKEDEDQKKLKCNKQSRKRETCFGFLRQKDKKRSQRAKKRPSKAVVESSDESDDEYRNKRRKLANAVFFKSEKHSSSTLKVRLNKMLCPSQNQENIDHNIKKIILVDVNSKHQASNIKNKDKNNAVTDSNPIPPIPENEVTTQSNSTENPVNIESIDLCTDDEVKITTTCNGANQEAKNNEVLQDNSDDDIELLRQYALKTKNTQAPKLTKESTTTEIMNKNKNNHLSEDEDSDTMELRLICLKSAWLKRAIEKKKKEKMKKRLSRSSNLQDDFMLDDSECSAKDDEENNTDIESVDMEIGSDGNEKLASNIEERISKKDTEIKEEGNVIKKSKSNEFDEDEEILRAKLLISLSKNVSSVINPLQMHNNIGKKNNIDTESTKLNSYLKAKLQADKNIQEKRFIIELRESDSEVEPEATKNLTKMHVKLSEQTDFQQKLDLFLKSTRMEVEKKKLPDVVQPNVVAPETEKFVPKALHHLPKSEQIEYNNLVKRMAELEKIKKARQNALNFSGQNPALVKETVKVQNGSIETKLVAQNNLDEQIAISRKKIAEESAAVLKLREDATKLSQKYKIAATELRNIATAITANKKQQRIAQMRLSKIRAQHQMLLKSGIHNSITATTKLQEKNNRIKEEYKNHQILKSVKVSVVNDLKKTVTGASEPKLSVQVDVKSDKKTVTMPNTDSQIKKSKDISDTTVTCIKSLSKALSETNLDQTLEEKELVKTGGNISAALCTEKNKTADDYKSPLQALQSATWQEDPNAVLCPYEFSGCCKDAHCQYLHPKHPSLQ